MQLTAVPIAQALPEDRVELWEERAAIMEYQGGLSRADAEWQAFLCLCGAREALGQEPQQSHPPAKDVQMVSLIPGDPP